jgi:uncharacterized membrane protein
MNPFDLPVHPVVVHFPVAMLVAAAVCVILRYLLLDEAWADRARMFERIGVATLPLTLVAGFVDTRGIGFLRDRRWDQPLIWHAIVASATTAVFVVHFVWSRRVASRPTLRMAAVDVGLISAGAWGLLLTGAIAGEMVYGA